MGQNGITHVPVVDANKYVIGIVTKNDMSPIKSFVEEEEKTADHLMTKEALTVGLGSSLLETTDLMI